MNDDVHNREIAQEIAFYGIGDFQMDSNICAIVSEYRSGLFSCSVRDRSIKVLRHMIDEKLISIGQLVLNSDNLCELQDWTGSTDEVIDRLQKEWPEHMDCLDGLGDVFWTQNTEKGDVLGGTFVEPDEQ